MFFEVQSTSGRKGEPAVAPGVGKGGVGGRCCCRARMSCVSSVVYPERRHRHSLRLFYLILFYMYNILFYLTCIYSRTSGCGFLNQECGRPAGSYPAGAAQSDLSCEAMQSLSAAHLARRGGDWQNYHTRQTSSTPTHTQQLSQFLAFSLVQPRYRPCVFMYLTEASVYIQSTKYIPANE